jgi:hypothetical protein
MRCQFRASKSWRTVNALKGNGGESLCRRTSGRTKIGGPGSIQSPGFVTSDAS